MTSEEYDKLKDYAKRTKIAELLGWTQVHVDRQWLSIIEDIPREALIGVPPDRMYVGSSSYAEVPNYMYDLNACHEFELTLKSKQKVTIDWWNYRDNLQAICKLDGDDFADGITATAEQRCKAFVLTRTAKDEV